MAESKHTPGPWTAEPSDDDLDLGEFTIKDADGGYIADVRNPYVDYDMQVAFAAADDCPLEGYARLIAAAPELLDALRSLLVLSSQSEFVGDASWAAVTQAARAAIVKAEGGAQ